LLVIFQGFADAWLEGFWATKRGLAGMVFSNPDIIRAPRNSHATPKMSERLKQGAREVKAITLGNLL
jgi:hypothetical protein